MIALRPFRAWRPAAHLAHLVGSRSYVSYNAEQLAEKLHGNPYTYLHVIHPDGMVPEELTRQERFRRVRQAFDGFCGEGIMQRDASPCFYVYEQSSAHMRSCGLVAGVSVSDLLEGRIKVHEHTLTAREQLFSEYLQHTGINAEPVLLASPPGVAWAHLLEGVTARRPEYDLSTTDKVRHRLWVVSDTALIDGLKEAFRAIPALYIADGHHRMASSARLAAALGVGEAHPAAWCLAFIVPDSQLHIRNFDRLVTDLGGHDEASFLEALARVGRLEPVAGPSTAEGIIGVYTPSGWHHLHLPAPPGNTPPDALLDPARLSDLVLAPVLGLHDLRTDPRVRFVPGTEGTAKLMLEVDLGRAAVAFHLHPVSFQALQAVADSGGTMPPKSTYIEPKLRSGFTVYPLEEDRP